MLRVTGSIIKKENEKKSNGSSANIGNVREKIAIGVYSEGRSGLTKQRERKEGSMLYFVVWVSLLINNVKCVEKVPVGPCYTYQRFLNESGPYNTKKEAQDFIVKARHEHPKQEFKIVDMKS
jgi:hypothetical protein